MKNEQLNFGLSSIFIAIIFLGNGLICILGGFAYLLNLVLLVFLCTNLGMGIWFLVALIALTVWFKKEGELLT